MQTAALAQTQKGALGYTDGMKRSTYGAIAVAVVGICMGFVMGNMLVHARLCTVPPAAPDHELFSWRQSKAAWLDILQGCGGTQSYHLFEEYVASENPKWQHTLAHVFGDALYDTEGVNGTAVCDMQFAQGCFHGFFGRAAQASGVGVIRDLEPVCYEELPSVPAKYCVHGIGHGLANLSGYTEDGLVRALASCDSLVRPDSPTYCAGGVFMEYNTHLLTDQLPRKETGDLMTPCNAVSTDKKEVCYFWQAQWWQTIFSNNDTTDQMQAVIQTAALCRQIGSEYHRACFEGIGRASGPAAQFDQSVAGALCDSAAAADTDARLYCRSYAAALFYFGFNRGVAALTLCAPLKREDGYICKDYAQHSYNGIGPGPLQTLD